MTQIIQNIAELKLRKGRSGTIVEVSGYYSANDGGGGKYQWDNTSTATDDGGSVIAVTGVTTGRWIAIFDDNIVNVKRFGAKGDGSTDDYNSILKAIQSGYKYIYFPSGTYLTGTTIGVDTSNIVFDGNGVNSIIRKVGDGNFRNIFTVGVTEANNCNNIQFRNLRFTSDGNDKRVYAINTSHAKKVSITNCSFDGLATCIKFSGTASGQDFDVLNCLFENSYMGVYANCPNTKVIGCRAYNIGSDFLIGGEDIETEQGHGPVIYFGSTGSGKAYLDGMVISDCNFESGKNAAIKLANCTVVVTNVTAKTFLYGLTTSSCRFSINNMNIENIVDSPDLGAMRLSGSSGTVNNCYFYDNNAYGIYCVGGQEIIISDCIFKGDGDFDRGKTPIISYGVLRFSVFNCKFINTKNTLATTQYAILLTNNGGTNTGIATIRGNEFLDAAKGNWISSANCNVVYIEKNIFKSTVSFSNPAINIATSIISGTLIDNIFDAPNNSMHFFATDIRTVEMYNNYNVQTGGQNQYQKYEIRNKIKIQRLSAPPTSGAWLVGDRIDNTSITTSSPTHWICTTAGTGGVDAVFKPYNQFLNQTVNTYTSDSESSPYTGIDNTQVGTVYAQLTDLNSLRTAYENLRTSYDDLRSKLISSGIITSS